MRAVREKAAAGWAGWLAAYEACWLALPAGEARQACPECGADALRLTFTGSTELRVGYASFWCDACLTGIHLSRCPVPEGVPMESLDTPVEHRAVRAPDYTLVWPDEEA